uniref:Uncharacterized protein n=1 Tax=Kalanchoe fedtschenkoi TaxID=63787 RepID=A0A7N0SZD8_KALFE
MTHSWLSFVFSEGKAPSISEFEAWFDMIAASLSDDVKSTPRSHLLLHSNSCPNRRSYSSSKLSFVFFMPKLNLLLELILATVEI